MVSTRLSAAADQDRRARPLHRQRPPGVGRRSCSARRARSNVPSPKAPSMHVEPLDEAVDAHARAVVGDARSLVVGGHPAGAEPDLQPSVGQHVDRRQLLGQHDGVLVVVVPHERADAQGRRRRAAAISAGTGASWSLEVVGHRQHRVPAALHPLGQLDPARAIGGARRLDAEPERTGRCRGASRAATVVPALWRR